MILRLRATLQSSPAAARVFPFAIFVILTAAEGHLGATSAFWIYPIKSILAGWMLVSIRSALPELKWTFSWIGLSAGVILFALWVGLDGFYPRMGTPRARNPFDTFGPGLAWFFFGVHWIGSITVVPPLEELFYRSFFYRYLIQPNFETVPLTRFHPLAFTMTSLAFGVVHVQWLPGILCGLALQALVLRRGRLGEAMLAHAVTNGLLGLWVVERGAWRFW